MSRRVWCAGSVAGAVAGKFVLGHLVSREPPGATTAWRLSRLFFGRIRRRLHWGFGAGRRNRPVDRHIFRVRGSAGRGHRLFGGLGSFGAHRRRAGVSFVFAEGVVHGATVVGVLVSWQATAVQIRRPSLLAVMDSRICTAVQYEGTTNVTLSWLVSFGSIRMFRSRLVMRCCTFYCRCRVRWVGDNVGILASFFDYSAACVRFADDFQRFVQGQCWSCCRGVAEQPEFRCRHDDGSPQILLVVRDDADCSFSLGLFKTP